jgi:hypothetical protein
MAIGTFNERIAVAVAQATARFPDARLHVAVASASTGPTTTPMALDRLKALFRTADGTVLVLEETGYGEFGPLRRPDPPPSLPPPIDWPVEMGLAEADNLKEDAAWIDPYLSVTLRTGSGGGPEFVFAGPHGPEVIVDVRSGAVREAAR